MWWTVRAESEAGQVITFGLRAVARDRAYLTALERLPWSPREIDLQLVPLIPVLQPTDTSQPKGLSEGLS